jgi:membrane protein DedA with SNARE-associated domain
MIADTAPLLALAGLILVKESGIPIPVPGDVVVLGAGVAASRGDLDPGLALAALIVASVVGGAIQFGLLRSVARPVVLRLLARIGSGGRVETQTERLRRRGARGVAVARVTPGLRIVAIAASALAGIPPAAFLIGLVAGNGVFIAAHFGLGYLLGEPVLTVVGGALGPLGILGVAVAAVGAAGWLLLSRRRRIGRREPGTEIETALAWTDACCPACLALAAVGRG